MVIVRPADFHTETIGGMRYVMIWHVIQLSLTQSSCVSRCNLIVVLLLLRMIILVVTVVIVVVTTTWYFWGSSNSSQNDAPLSDGKTSDEAGKTPTTGTSDNEDRSKSSAAGPISGRLDVFKQNLS